MMISTVAGRLYNGKAHDWTQNKGKDDETDRTLFRGRLNFRETGGSNYHWIDAVCFKDFGAKGGLVAWLDEHYAAENSESGENGGDGIILNGYVRPTEKRKTIEIKGKKNGKTVTKEIPNVPYDTFEFVITDATFPPTSNGEGRRSDDVETDEDFDELDDIEISDGDDDDAGEEEVEEKPKKKPSSKSKPASKSKGKKKKEPEPDDDDFFEDDK
jgi:hypothetical protein